MHVIQRPFFLILVTAACFCGSVERAFAQGTDVIAQARVKFAGVGASAEHRSSEGVVMWLTAADGNHKFTTPEPEKARFQLAQKNKEFVPHLLVVPVGSVVQFPNLDPFFHNVFSLFDGKRFDLGLYESGSTRSVHFDRAGISYIFCNIHPEMSAVIIAVPTSYYAVSSTSGVITIHDVPAGEYIEHIWAMGDSESTPKVQGRHLIVSGKTMDIGEITVTESALPPHKNKFGESYGDKKSSSY